MHEEYFAPEEFALDEGEVDPMNPIGEEDEEDDLDDDAPVEGTEDADAI